MTIQSLEPPLGLRNTRKSFLRSPVMLGLTEGLLWGQEQTILFHKHLWNASCVPHPVLGSPGIMEGHGGGR